MNNQQANPVKDALLQRAIGLIERNEYINLEDLLNNNMDLLNYKGQNLEITLLHTAILDNREQILINLLNREGVDVNIRNKHGETPLYYACLWGRLNLVQILLENGADKNLENNLGEKPIHLINASIQEENDKLQKIQEQQQIMQGHNFGPDLQRINERLNRYNQIKLLLEEEPQVGGKRRNKRKTVRRKLRKNKSNKSRSKK